MKGLVFDTENRIQLKDFGEPLLDNLQKEVGGYIEVVHPKYLPEGLCMVVDDEGLLKGSPVNNIASILKARPLAAPHNYCPWIRVKNVVG